MQLSWRYLLAGAIFTALLIGLLLGTEGTSAAVPLALVTPALWLATRILGRVITTYDRGSSSFMSVVFVIALLNTVFYTVVFSFLRKASDFMRRLPWLPFRAVPPGVVDESIRPSAIPQEKT